MDSAPSETRLYYMENFRPSKLGKGYTRKRGFLLTSVYYKTGKQSIQDA